MHELPPRDLPAADQRLGLLELHRGHGLDLHRRDGLKCLPDVRCRVLRCGRSLDVFELLCGLVPDSRRCIRVPELRGRHLICRSRRCGRGDVRDVLFRNVLGRGSQQLRCVRGWAVSRRRQRNGLLWLHGRGLFGDFG